MRSVVIIDKLIDKDEALALLDEFGAFFKKHTDIDCEWYVERRDFSEVPTVPDSDGDMKPTWSYRQALCKDVHDRYGDYGTDNVVMWVHEDNFLYRGVWGVNWSYSHFKYSLQLCRWDKDNSVNSFGTLYHELMHSFDRLIKEETGFEVDPLFGQHWDSIVHGKGKWDYIGRKTGRENTEALEQIAVHLRDAYHIRKSKHFAPVREAQLTIIAFLKRLLGRLR